MNALRNYSHSSPHDPEEIRRKKNHERKLEELEADFDRYMKEGGS
jgi:hypothetical protein